MAKKSKSSVTGFAALAAKLDAEEKASRASRLVANLATAYACLERENHSVNASKAFDAAVNAIQAGLTDLDSVQRARYVMTLVEARDDARAIRYLDALKGLKVEGADFRSVPFSKKWAHLSVYFSFFNCDFSGLNLANVDFQGKVSKSSFRGATLGRVSSVRDVSLGNDLSDSIGVGMSPEDSLNMLMNNSD